MKECWEKFLSEIVQIRHQIHANPELANEEIKTASLITNTLHKHGYEVTFGFAGTGVTAVLDSGKPGKTVALRAEMDALPIQEKTNLSYKSKNNGKMHACGHDGHTATLLLVAVALALCKKQFRGKIKFIFQPAEETGQGAAAMIKRGVLDHPKVNAIFGCHNISYAPGVLITKTGCILAGQDTFQICVKGRGGHAADLYTTINPINIGSEIIQTIQKYLSTLKEPVVASVTQFHAGTTHNIIPDEAFIEGSIRTLTAETQKKIKQRLTKIAQEIATRFGGSSTIKFPYHFPPTINHLDETQLVLNAAKKILGNKNVVKMESPAMASEDFSHYLLKIPGCFFFIGNGMKKGLHHTAKYEFNDALILLTAQLMGQIAIDYLNQPS